MLLALGAVVLAGFWALPPLLTPLIYLCPTDWTEADLVRHLWHFRLVPPEWASTPPDYARWAQAETLARLAVVFLIWLAGTMLLARKYSGRRKGLAPLGSAGNVVARRRIGKFFRYITSRAPIETLLRPRTGRTPAGPAAIPGFLVALWFLVHFVLTTILRFLNFPNFQPILPESV